MTQVTETKQEHTNEEQTRPGRTYVPSVDITETEDALRVWADLPGVDEKSVEVRLEQGLLSIEGHLSLEGYEDLSPVYTEYNVGNFVRRFRVPSSLDTARIEGKMANGVLELTIPRSESARPRRVEITAGS